MATTPHMLLQRLHAGSTGYGNQLIQYLLIALLLYAPLLCGSVYPWTVALIAFFSLTIFMLWLFKPHGCDAALFQERRYRYPLKPLYAVTTVPGWFWIVCFIGSILIQLIPLPSSIIQWLSPARCADDRMYLLPLHQDDTHTLSIYPFATMYGLIAVVSYCLIFCVTAGRTILQDRDCSVHIIGEHTIPRFYRYLALGMFTSILALLLHSLCDFNLRIPANALYFAVILGLAYGIHSAAVHKKKINRQFIDLMVNTMIIIGFFVAVFGLIQRWTSDNKMYWIIPAPGCLFGPFVSYNHFAGFMELCIPLAIAGFFAQISTISLSGIAGFRNKCVYLLSQQAHKTILYLFSAIIMMTALFFCLSRGGIMSFLAAILVYCCSIMYVSQGPRRMTFFVLIICVAALVSVMLAWIGPDVIMSRFHYIQQVIHEPILNQTRPRMWLDTCAIFRDYPVTGCGLETFGHVYPRYRTVTDTVLFARYPENEYIQMAAEMGIVGILFLILFLFYYVRAFIWSIQHTGSVKKAQD